MPDWKIWYADGSTFDSSQGSMADAPPFGVIVIAQADHETGKYLVQSSDYYVYLDTAWVGLDRVGLIDYIGNVLKKVKFGRMVKNKDFGEIMEKALDDPDMPTRTAGNYSENPNKPDG